MRLKTVSRACHTCKKFSPQFPYQPRSNVKRASSLPKETFASGSLRRLRRSVGASGNGSCPKAWCSFKGHGDLRSRRIRQMTIAGNPMMAWFSASCSGLAGPPIRRSVRAGSTNRTKDASSGKIPTTSVRRSISPLTRVNGAAICVRSATRERKLMARLSRRTTGRKLPLRSFRRSPPRSPLRAAVSARSSRRSRAADGR